MSQSADNTSAKTSENPENNIQEEPQTLPQTNKADNTPASSSTSKQETFVTMIKTRAEYDEIIQTTKDKNILVWFSSDWCATCKILVMRLDELEKKYRNKIEILKVDVNDLEDLALENDVSQMPAFMLMRNGKRLDFYFGSKEEKLFEMVDKYLENNS